MLVNGSRRAEEVARMAQQGNSQSADWQRGDVASAEKSPTDPTGVLCIYTWVGGQRSRPGAKSVNCTAWTGGVLMRAVPHSLEQRLNRCCTREEAPLLGPDGAIT